MRWRFRPKPDILSKSRILGLIYCRERMFLRVLRTKTAAVAWLRAPPLHQVPSTARWQPRYRSRTYPAQQRVLCGSRCHGREAAARCLSLRMTVQRREPPAALSPNKSVPTTAYAPHPWLVEPPLASLAATCIRQTPIDAILTILQWPSAGKPRLTAAARFRDTLGGVVEFPILRRIGSASPASTSTPLASRPSSRTGTKCWPSSFDIVTRTRA